MPPRRFQRTKYGYPSILSSFAVQTGTMPFLETRRSGTRPNTAQALHSPLRNAAAALAGTLIRCRRTVRWLFRGQLCVFLI